MTISLQRTTASNRITGRRRLGTSLVTLGLLATAACGGSTDSDTADSDSSGQVDYPTQRVEFVVPYAPGGGTDITGRLLGTALQEEFGESVTVVNKPGGGGALGVGYVADASTDGHTMGVATDGNIVLQPVLEDVGYKAEDIKALRLVEITFVLVAKAGSPYTSLTELVEAAKASPGKIRIAHPGVGGPNDLTIRALELAADIDVASVPITGGGAEINQAVAGGQVELAMTTVPVAKGFVDAGQLIITGSMGDEAAPGAPDSQTLKEADITSDPFVLASVNLIVPAGVEQARLDKLAETVEDVLKDEEFRKKAVDLGYTVSFGGFEETSDALAEALEGYQRILDENPTG